MQTQKIDHSRSIGRELLRNIGLTALIVFGLGTLAKADEIVPAEYQRVSAAARNCNDNLQHVESDAVNRKLAACRVTQVVSSGDPESHMSTVSLNCGGLQSREIWHDESSEDADYLVIVQLEPGAAAGRPSIDLYKRCPEIPLGEIPLSDIPGNPIVNAAAEEKTAPPLPLESCAIVHFHIRAQPACGSTDLNEEQQGRKLMERSPYEPGRQKERTALVRSVHVHGNDI